MANDPVVVARMARALKDRAAGTGSVLNEQFFAALADQAVTECGRVVTIVQDVLQVEPFLVLTRPSRGDQLRVLGTAATVFDAVNLGTAHLQREGIGSVSLAEIRRVLTVQG